MATPNAGVLAQAGHSALEVARSATARFGITGTAAILLVTVFLVYSVVEVGLKLPMVDSI